MTERLPTLLAFAPMINAEATRCVLEYYGIRYREVNRFLGWANVLTFFHGGYGELPLLHGRGLRLSGPMPIVRRFDAERDRPRLLPPDEPLRSEIEREWKLFLPGLSSEVALLAYFYLLPQTELMIKSFGAPLGPTERAALPLIYPTFRSVLSRLLGFSPSRIEDSKRSIDEILDRVDQRLAHHSYMVGDRLTLADIGMVSASAPILLPEHYARWIPPLAQLPSEFAAIITQARSRPCALYANRIYDEISQASRRA